MPKNFIVSYAVYGALYNGNSESAAAFDVSTELDALLNAQGSTGIVQCGNNLKGDPAQGNKKHFGALVNDRFYACEEGQTIDFSQGGGLSAGDPGPDRVSLVVQFAVYGALAGGDKNKAQAFDVTALLQAELNLHGGTVTCGNSLFGDPSPNNQKHFAAVITRHDLANYGFACAEGQTIVFNYTGGYF